MISLKGFKERYDTETVPLEVRGRKFRFHVPKSIDRLIDQKDIFQGFPLWAKIWEASLVLADHLASRTPEHGKRILEIGAGMGLVGVVASAFGHRVTMTEYSKDALNFCMANAEENREGREGELEVASLNWHSPTLEGTFSMIVGSEVVYAERDFDPLSGLFSRYLQVGGEILLAEGLRATSMEFFRRMGLTRSISARKMMLRSNQKEIPIVLASIRGN